MMSSEFRCADGSAYKITKNLSIADELKLVSLFGNQCYTSVLGDDYFQITADYFSDELLRLMDPDIVETYPDIKKQSTDIVNLCMDSAADGITGSPLNLTHFNLKMGILLEFLGKCIEYHLSSLISALNNRQFECSAIPLDENDESVRSKKLGMSVIALPGCVKTGYFTILPVSAAKQQKMLFEIAGPIKRIKNNLYKALADSSEDALVLDLFDLDCAGVNDTLLMSIIIMLIQQGKFYVIFDTACKDSCFFYENSEMSSDNKRVVTLSFFEGELGQLLMLLRECVKVNLSDFFYYQVTPPKI